MKTAARRARRMDPIERREQLANAGATVAVEGGLEAVTLRSVAARAGVAYGLVGHYFTSAEELRATAFSAATRSDLDATTAAISTKDNPLDQLTALLERWVSPHRDDIGLLWLDAWSAARQNELLRRAVDEAMQAGHDLVVALLQDGIDSGPFVCHDAAATAWRLLTLLDGQIIHSSLSVDDHVVDVKVAVTEWMEGELSLPVGALKSEPNRKPRGR